MFGFLNRTEGLRIEGTHWQSIGTQKAAAESNAVIAAQDLKFRWRNNTAWVIDIEELLIRKGEHVLVMGPSGSGKTTLLNLLTGVAIPDSGILQVLDADVHHMNGPKRDVFRADHIGFVFQMFNLIPYLSVVDNVILPVRFSSLRHQQFLGNGTNPADEAKRLLNRLGLPVDELDRQPVTDLSVGQQQRVAVARALIGRPELVVCDEPTSAMDAETQALFLKLLFQEVDQADATLIVVSHDQSLSSYFDRTIILPHINRAGKDREVKQCN